MTEPPFVDDLDYRPSYWLKYHRASEHFVELDDLVKPYSNPRPYEIRHTVQGKRKEHVYTAHAIGNPDPFIAIVLGDFLFALRSALDHLRVAIAPRSERYGPGFPIFTEDPFCKDPVTRKYIERSPENRKRWNSTIRGIDPVAVAEITNMQPFRYPKAWISDLGLTDLGRLNNADKHRELVPVFHHLDPESVTVDGETTPIPPHPIPHSVYANGAMIYRSDREVNVEARGGLVVTVPTAGPRKDLGYSIMERSRSILDYVSFVIGRLGRFDPNVPRLYEIRYEAEPLPSPPQDDPPPR